MKLCGSVSGVFSIYDVIFASVFDRDKNFEESFQSHNFQTKFFFSRTFRLKILLNTVFFFIPLEVQIQLYPDN